MSWNALDLSHTSLCETSFNSSVSSSFDMEKKLHDVDLLASFRHDPYAPTRSPSSTPSSTPSPKACSSQCILSVQFKFGRVGEFWSERRRAPGTHLVVEGDRGEDLGMVIDWRMPQSGDEGNRLIKKVIRKASQAEVDFWRIDLVKREHEALKVAQEIVKRRNIPLQVVHMEYQFDTCKLTVHFVSKDAHPRFREALDECYAVWKCRIWFARYSRTATDNECRRQLSDARHEGLDIHRKPSTSSSSDSGSEEAPSLVSTLVRSPPSTMQSPPTIIRSPPIPPSAAAPTPICVTPVTVGYTSFPVVYGTQVP